MTQGLKIWLWFILVVNSIVTVFIAIGCLLNPMLIITLGLEVALISGDILLLFKQRKIGFFIMVTSAAIGLIINLVSGKTNIFIAISSAILAPIITYLLMRKNWDKFK